MLGSDIVTARFDASKGTAIVEDRWVDWVANSADAINGGTPTPNIYPQLDEYNDWTIQCFSNDASSISTIVTRLLDTGDGQDRVFASGTLPVIYSWGSSFGYHGANRGSDFVTFHGSSNDFVVPSDADRATGDIALSYTGTGSGNMAGWPMNAQVTQYVCQAFDLSSYGSRHIVAIEPIYPSSDGAPYVHHTIVHACGTSKSAVTDRKIRSARRKNTPTLTHLRHTLTFFHSYTIHMQFHKALALSGRS